jgi:hypothetical protein
VPEGKYVRPRLSDEELWMLYKLVDSRYWFMRRNPRVFRNIETVSRLRLKLLRNLNKGRGENRLSARRRFS